MRVVRGEVTLSVQDLVCDGCRGVSVEGGFVGVVGGGWREMVSCTVSAFGVCCWDGAVVAWGDYVVGSGFGV